MTGTIRQSNTLGAMVKRVLAQTRPKVLDRLEGAAETLAASARDRWPVSGRKDRPHSADLIATGNEGGAGTFGTFVVLPVPYAFYVKSYKNGLAGASPWQELIRKPGIAAGKQIAVDCARDLAALSGGGRG